MYIYTYIYKYIYIYVYIDIYIYTYIFKEDLGSGVVLGHEVVVRLLERVQRLLRHLHCALHLRSQARAFRQADLL